MNTTGILMKIKLICCVNTPVNDLQLNLIISSLINNHLDEPVSVKIFVISMGNEQPPLSLISASLFTSFLIKFPPLGFSH